MCDLSEESHGFSEWNCEETCFDVYDLDPLAVQSSAHTVVQSTEEEEGDSVHLKPKHDSESPPGAGSDWEQDEQVVATDDNRESEWDRDTLFSKCSISDCSLRDDQL